MYIRKMEKIEFPEELLEIPHPPKELWIKGYLPEENLIKIAFVGSRTATSYGKDVCEKIIKELTGYPFCIVSGLAMGIDTIAHKQALNCGLKTIAIPGSGLSEKTIYPRVNFLLSEEIVKNGGCLISEFEPDFKATVWSFPQRNRIMAGLSKAVVIIEAKEKSGTLITARLSLDYNKELLAVPGSIFSENSKGTNKLIKEGAMPITSGLELLELFNLKKEDTEKNEQLELFKKCTQDEKEVISLLNNPKERTELLSELNKNIGELNIILTMLEIKGLIKEELGKIRKVF